MYICTSLHHFHVILKTFVYCHEMRSEVGTSDHHNHFPLLDLLHDEAPARVLTYFRLDISVSRALSHFQAQLLCILPQFLGCQITGNYAGILFFGDPDAPPTTSHTVTGNGDMLYEGYMYFRTAELKVNGNGNGESSAYVGAVARSIRFGGNGEMVFAYDPIDANVPVIAGGSTVTMVE